MNVHRVTTYFIKYVPCFRQVICPEKISPNLCLPAGPAFALGHRFFKASDPAYAHKLLMASRHIFLPGRDHERRALTWRIRTNLSLRAEWLYDMDGRRLNLAALRGEKMSPARTVSAARHAIGASLTLIPASEHAPPLRCEQSRPRRTLSRA